MRIEAGELTLTVDSVTGLLPALLEALDIPISSQGMVFSRTSLQTDLIAPGQPVAGTAGLTDPFLRGHPR